MLHESDDTNIGVDIFWRPNASQQLSVALNPDFGQVESDGLVVNFSPFETFFAGTFFSRFESFFSLSKYLKVASKTTWRSFRAFFIEK